MAKCPFCAEEIQDDAAKCKHCSEWLDPSKKPPSETVSPAPVIAASPGKPNYSAFKLYRYSIVERNGRNMREGVVFGRDEDHARQQIAKICPDGFEYDATKGLQVEPDGRLTCPNCGSQFTNCKRDIGCAIGILFFVSLGLGLLLIPLLPFKCDCRACNFKWKS